MRKIAIGVIVIVSIILSAGCIGIGSKPIPITYYASSKCDICMKMDQIFENLTKSHDGEFILTKYNIDNEQVKFYNDQIKYHGDGSIPFVIAGNITINGYNEETAYTMLEYVINNRVEIMKQIPVETNI